MASWVRASAMSGMVQTGSVKLSPRDQGWWTTGATGMVAPVAAYTKAWWRLLLFLGDGGLGGGEADAAVRAVAERLGDRGAAAAEGHAGPARGVDAGAGGIVELDVVALHDVGAVRSCG